MASEQERAAAASAIDVGIVRALAEFARHVQDARGAISTAVCLAQHDPAAPEIAKLQQAIYAPDGNGGDFDIRPALLAHMRRGS